MIEISSLIFAAFVVGLVIAMLLLSLQFNNKNDMRALLIWVAADSALTLYRGFTLLQPGWPFERHFPTIITQLDTHFWMPLFITLSQVLGVLALAKVRQINLARPLSYALVLLPLVTSLLIYSLTTNVGLTALGWAGSASASGFITHLVLFAVSVVMMVISCMLVWPLARDSRGAKSLLALMVSQVIYSAAVIALMFTDQYFMPDAEASSVFVVFLIMIHFVVEISKTLAFILLLNERQFAALKKQNEGLDKRVLETTIALSERNQLLEKQIAQAYAFQNELRDTEQSFRSLAENIPHNILRHDLAGRIVYANPEMLETLAVSASDLLGYKVADVFPSTEFPTFQPYHEALQQVLAHARTIHLEIIVPKPDGLNQTHAVSLVPEFDVEGRLIKVLGLGRDITERKEMEAQLFERERLFRTLAENIPDNIIRHDLDGRILYMNPQIEKSLHVKLSDVLGQVTYDIFPDEIYPSFKPYHDILKNIALTRQAVELEVVIPMPDGNNEIRHVSLVPEFDEQGEFCSVLTLGHDITKRVKLENELREREREFRSLAENIPHNIIRHDTEMRILYINPKLEKTLNIQSNEVVGRLMQDVFSTQQLASSRAAIQQALSTGQPVQLELNVTKTNGTDEIHEVSFVPEFNTQGLVCGLIAIGQDITERKKIQNELQKREREFRSLADNFPYMIARYDTQFRRTYVNRAYEELMGVTAQQVIQQPIDSVWLASKFLTLENFKCNMQKVLESKAPHDFFIKWQGEDGLLNFREMLLIPEFDDDGQVSSILAVGHDTKTYESAMIELNQVNAKLRKLSASKEIAREEERKHIAREIHDELGQLLHVIRLHASTLDYLYGSTQPEVRDKTKKVMELADQAIYTIKNIITRLRPAIMDHGLLYALTILVEDFSRHSGIAYQLHTADGCIKFDEKSETTAFRIVQEALTNIMRHSGADFITVNISLIANNIEIKIVDNGCGFNIDATHRSSTFGLIGMQERVEAISGTLEIISQPGQGTVIVLCFPVG